MNNIFDPVFIFGAKYSHVAVILITFAWLMVQPRLRQKEVLAVFCACLPLVLLVSLLASHIYYSPRPFVLGGFKPLIPHEANNGFPSHHVLLVSAVSAVVFIFSRRLGLLLWALTLFVGFSRVYAGVHHIIDAIGSVLISIIMTVLGFYFVKYLRNHKSEGS
ncbi:MAG: phosphatase PAP2 family protein [Candidatus Omnitrophota bacterium]